MNSNGMEFSENLERAVKGTEHRGNVVAEMRQFATRFKQKEEEYKRAGYDVIYTVCKRGGNKDSDIFMLKGPDGNYSVKVDGKTTIQARTRDDCAKQAYIAGYIGYFTRVEIGQGKAAAERAKKDPATLERLKKAGTAANAY